MFKTLMFFLKYRVNKLEKMIKDSIARYLMKKSIYWVRRILSSESYMFNGGHTAPIGDGISVRIKERPEHSFGSQVLIDPC